MYGKKSVTTSDRRKPSRVKSVSRDKRHFSNTAGLMHKANVQSSGTVMRGGIRL